MLAAALTSHGSPPCRASAACVVAMAAGAGLMVALMPAGMLHGRRQRGSWVVQLVSLMLDVGLAGWCLDAPCTAGR